MLCHPLEKLQILVPFKGKTNPTNPTGFELPSCRQDVEKELPRGPENPLETSQKCHRAFWGQRDTALGCGTGVALLPSAGHGVTQMGRANR